jgi:hypothetical protein
VTLIPGSEITAVQSDANDESPHSPPVVVQKKPPTIGQVTFNGPVYRCGRCLQVAGAAPGAVAQVTVGGTLRGEADAPTGVARIQLSEATAANDVLQAMQIDCGTVGTKISAGTPLDPTKTKSLPSPVVMTPHACDETIRVSGVCVGASVTVNRSASPPVALCFDKETLYVLVKPPLEEGETITVKQAFPGCRLQSPAAHATVQALEPIPKPVVWPLCEGDKYVTITNLRPGAAVLVIADDDELGWGQAPDGTQFTFPIPPVKTDQKVTCLQRLCSRDSEVADPQVVVAGGGLQDPTYNHSLFACGGAVGVWVDLESPWVRLDSKLLGAPVAEGKPALPIGQGPWLTVLHPQPLLISGDEITLVSFACNGSTKKATTTVQPSGKLTPPILEPKQFVGQKSVGIKLAQPGAWVEVFVNDQWAGGVFLPDYNGHVGIGPLSLKDGDKVRGRQRLCGEFSALSPAVTVVQKPPKANFVATPVSGEAPLTVNFTDQSSGKIDSWEWDRNGDGAPDSIDKNPPLFTFNDPGDYTVKLTVKNSGGMNSASVAIKVNAPVPTPPADPDLDGVFDVRIYNCHWEYRPLNIWRRDVTAQGSWTELGVQDVQYDQGSQSCPVGPPFIVPLTDGHVYEIVCVDIGGSVCGANDPTNLGCQRLYAIALGDSNGQPAEEIVI